MTFRSYRCALILALGAATLSGPVLSGPAMAQGGGPITTGLRGSVFFSPSGQPFRAKDGEPYPEAAWFAQADADHDGKISHDEFVADATNVFKMLDVNHDNYISSPENTRYENQVAPEITSIDPRISQPINLHGDSDPSMGVDQDPTHGKYQKSIQGASQYGLIDEPQPVRAADANFDFRISMAEWLNATNQRFNMLDRNGDGFLTPDELPKTPLQRALETPREKEKPKKKLFGGW